MSDVFVMFSVLWRTAPKWPEKILINAALKFSFGFDTLWLNVKHSRWSNALHEVSSLDRFLPLCPAHSPLVNAVVVGERWMDVMNSFIIQTSVCLKRDNRTAVQAQRERERRPWLLMRVYHNDTTFLMHLSYEDLHKYTNTRGRVMHRCVSRH